MSAFKVQKGRLKIEPTSALRCRLLKYLSFDIFAIVCRFNKVDDALLAYPHLVTKVKGLTDLSSKVQSVETKDPSTRRTRNSVGGSERPQVKAAGKVGLRITLCNSRTRTDISIRIFFG